MVERTQTVKVDLEIEETQPGRFKIDTTMYIGIGTALIGETLTVVKTMKKYTQN